MFSECKASFYGENCSNSCGHCLNETACHHVNGTCDKECEPGYQTPYCIEGDCQNTLHKQFTCLEL